MKKILSMLGIITLISPSITSNPVVNNTNINDNNHFILKQKLIRSPKNTVLVTAGDWMTSRQEWCYTTINLGQLRQEQIVDFISTNQDSFTDHKVVNYGYHEIDPNAGINTDNFRMYFHEGQVREESWTYNTAVSQAAHNFSSYTSWGWASHNADGYVKFQWYYDINNNLLVDIVAALSVSGYLSTEEGVASVNLGTVFTIIYNE